MYCRQCGAEVAEGKRFCADCGARLDVPPPAPQQDVPPQPVYPPQQDYAQPDYPQQDYPQQDYPQQPDYSQQDYPQQDYAQPDYAQQAPRDESRPHHRRAREDRPRQPGQEDRPRHHRPRQTSMQPPAEDRSGQPGQEDRPHRPHKARHGQEERPQQPVQPPAAEAPRKKKSPALPILFACIGVVTVITLVVLFFPKLMDIFSSDETTQAAADVSAENGEAAAADSGTDADANAKYLPGNYVMLLWGRHILFVSPDAAEYVEADNGGAPVTVTEVRENTETDDVTRRGMGKTEVEDQTGWIRLCDYVCTDLQETEIDASQETAIWEKLYGIWNADVKNSVIFFEGENAQNKEIKFGVRSAGPDFYGMVTEPFYGDPARLIRITAATPEQDESDLDRYPEAEIYLYVDLTQIDEDQIAWSTDLKDWTVCFFVTDDPENYAALPAY